MIICFSRTHALEYKTSTIKNDAELPNTNQVPVQATLAVFSDFERVDANLSQTVNEYEEEKQRLAQEELEKKLAQEKKEKEEAQKALRLKAVQAMTGQNPENVGTGNLYSLAETYVGRLGDCFQLAKQLLNEYFGDNYTSQSSYQVSDPQEGDLIYYANGGLGTTHYGVYLGNGLAFQGNFNGSAKISSVYLNNASDPVYYRYG